MSRYSRDNLPNDYDAAQDRAEWEAWIATPAGRLEMVRLQLAELQAEAGRLARLLADRDGPAAPPDAEPPPF